MNYIKIYSKAEGTVLLMKTSIPVALLNKLIDCYNELYNRDIFTGSFGTYLFENNIPFKEVNFKEIEI